jgi:ketosteroid isomerase-like protein
MTPEEALIHRYFDAFNRHDIEAVMASFHDDALIVGGEGRRCEGRDAIRRQYESGFAAFPDGRCELRMCTGNSGNGVAESLFHGTSRQDGKVVEVIGAELMEIVAGKIKQIRDYHQRVPAKAA